MSDAKKEELELDNETPSTTKAKFQRWIIAFFFIVCLISLYAFLKGTKSQTVVEEKEERVIPTQTQDGVAKRPEAIREFQEKIENRSRGVAVDTSSGVNPELAPKYDKSKISEESLKRVRDARAVKDLPLSEQIRFKKKQDQEAEIERLRMQLSQQQNGNYSTRSSIVGNNPKEKESPLERAKTKGQEMAFQSRMSRDSLNGNNAFYENGQTRLSLPTKSAAPMMGSDRSPSAIKERQARIQSELDRTKRIIEGLQSGTLDPSNIPQDLLSKIQG